MMQPVSSPAVRCRKDFDGLAVRWPGEVRVGTMTAALRQDQLAQALKRGILAYRLLIIDEIGVPADGFDSRPGAGSKLGLLGPVHTIAAHRR